MFDEDEELGDNYYACSTAHAAKFMAAIDSILAARPSAGGGGGGGGGGEGGGEGGEAEAEEEEEEELDEEEIERRAKAKAKAEIEAMPMPPMVVEHPEAEKGVGKAIWPVFLTGDCRTRFNIAQGASEEDAAHCWVEKEPVLKDIQINGSISDWKDSAEWIDSCPGEKFFCVYDGKEVMGDIFYLATPEHAEVYLKAVEEAAKVQLRKYKDMKSAAILEAGLSESEEEEDPDAPPIVLREIQPSAAGWESQGSEEAVAALTVTTARPLLTMSFKRKRRGFGGMALFYDQDAAELDPQDIRKMSMEDPNYKLKRKLTTTAVQAVPEQVNAPTQTPYFRKQNRVIQYEPIAWNEAQRDEAMASDEMVAFLEITRDRYELALQQNEVVNLFEDPYKDGDGEGLDFAEKTDEEISETQNFQAKNTSVMCIEFQPGRKGIVGMCGREQGYLDERVENAGVLENAHIFVYDSTQAIAMEPIVVMDAPADVMSFRFNPTMPHIVVGGLKTGQVCMWDIQAAQQLHDSKRGKADKEKGGNNTIKPVAWSLFSNIEASHALPVSDVQWLSKGFKYDPKGKVEENNVAHQMQFVSASPDGMIIVWDCTYADDPAVAEKRDEDPLSYDCHWTPIWKTALKSSEGTGPFSIERLRWGPGLSWCCSSQEGEVARGEGLPYNAPTNTISLHHGGAVMVVEASPFLEGIYLTVGEWTFHVWKEGVAQPLYSSPYSPVFCTTGAWSPTRPGIVMIARADGVLQAWDLLWKIPEPVDSVTINNAALTTMAFGTNPTSSEKAKKADKGPQHLAVGDSLGTMHVMLMPGNLRKPVPNEKALVEALLNREVQRVAYVAERAEVRAAELVAKEAEAAKAAAAAAAAAAEAAKAAAAAGAANGAEEGEDVDPEAAKAAAAEAAKEAELAALEEEYLKAEAQFRLDLGLAVEGDGEEDD